MDSDIWPGYQWKLEKNCQIGNSVSNSTSWLAGKMVCEKCDHIVTTIKGKVNKSSEMRRYFNCTGRSHKKTCTGSKVTIYAEGLESMVYEYISAKLADLKGMNRTARRGDNGRGQQTEAENQGY